MRPQRRWPPKKSVAVALQLMGVMLESGVPFAVVFTAVQEQLDDPECAEIFGDIEYKVTRMGWKLSQAMREYDQVFPAYCVMFAAAGEASGNLFARLKRAGQVMEREVALQSQLRAALTGPFITMSVAALVLFALVRFVMPRFVDMYQGMGAELPGITRVVIAIVGVVNHWLFLVALVMLLLLVRFHRAAIREWLFSTMVRVPLFARWAGVVLGAQFCDVLASLLREGVPIVRAVHMLAETAPFETHKRHLRKVHRDLVEEGDFACSIEAVPYFPSLVQGMALVGQEIGSLDKLLVSLTRILEQEVDVAIASIVSLVEPVMICVMGVITAFFFVGLFMPVYGLLQNLGL